MGFRDETEAVRFQLRQVRDELEELTAERTALRERAREVESNAEARAKAVAGYAGFGGLALAVVVAAAVIGLTMVAGGVGAGETLYGHVRRASGSAPVPVGARCTFFVSGTNSDDYDAKIDAICDGRVVYGGGSMGFINCSEAGSHFEHCGDPNFSDDGGDPAFELMRSRRAVVIHDANPSWRLDIELTTPPSGTPLGTERGAP